MRIIKIWYDSQSCLFNMFKNMINLLQKQREDLLPITKLSSSGLVGFKQFTYVNHTLPSAHINDFLTQVSATCLFICFSPNGKTVMIVDKEKKNQHCIELKLQQKKMFKLSSEVSQLWQILCRWKTKWHDIITQCTSHYLFRLVSNCPTFL